MTTTIQNEIFQIMEYLHYDFPIEEFETKANFTEVSRIPLSEHLIEYLDKRAKINWLLMSKWQAHRFSKDFHEKYKNRILNCKMKQPM